MSETEITETEELTRIVVPELESILGKRFNVLDSGFIRLVDYMGSDESIVQAARVSYGKGTKKIHEDEGLLRYLMRHRHSTPFEMCEIKFHVRVPMDHWRQWIRHRMANVNEYSTRYSEAIDAAQETLPGEWRIQAVGNRQGSAGSVDNTVGERLSKREARLHKLVRGEYENRIKLGVAREQARKDLPLSTYTEAYWKCDLHNLLHFLSLRMDSHAQLEIRKYANTIGEIVSKWVPLTWQAFLDYRHNAMALSARDMAVIKALNSSDFSTTAKKLAESYGWLKNGKPSKNRERDEFESKLQKLGMITPW